MEEADVMRAALLCLLVFGCVPDALPVFPVTPPPMPWPDPDQAIRAVQILPRSTPDDRYCLDAGPVQLHAVLRDSGRVTWWSSAGVAVVDSTGLVSRYMDAPGFSYVAIIATQDSVADTAWLVFAGLKWPNEPGGAEGVWCA